MDLITIELIQREAKVFTFNIKDEDGNAIDVSSAVCSFYGKESLGATTYKFIKSDSDFNHTLGSTGVLSVILNKNDLDFYGWAYAVLKVIITSGSDENKQIFKLYLTKSSE